MCCAGLWEDASFKLHGNLFWPDFWPPGTSSEAQEVVYDMVGLDATKTAVSAVCDLVNRVNNALTRWHMHRPDCTSTSLFKDDDQP